MRPHRQRPLELSEDERDQLSILATRKGGSRRVARRARLVLLVAEGHSNHEVAQALGVNQQTVAVWRRRFTAGRLESLRDRSPAHYRPPGGTQGRVGQPPLASGELPRRPTG